MKKQEIAKKMRYSATNDTIEGDAPGTDVYENKFSKKDVKKEQKSRKEKHGKIPKSNWQI